MGTALSFVERRLAEIRATIKEVDEAFRTGRRNDDPRPIFERLRSTEAELALLHSQLKDNEVKEFAAEAAARRAEDFRVLVDERNFWSRRFTTTLAIANAVAFTGIVTGLSQAENPTVLGSHMGAAATWFASGMIAAGMAPLLLFIRARFDRLYSSLRDPPFPINLLSGLVDPRIVIVAVVAASLAGSAVSFLAGLMSVVGVINGLKP